MMTQNLDFNDPDFTRHKKGPKHREVNYHPEEHPRVLVIDDDVDVATMLESIFHNLGCETHCASSAAEAKHEICSGKAGLIILDWILQSNLTGGGLLAQVISTVNKFHDLQRRMAGHPPKVITYSVLPPSQIQFPGSSYFRHLGHWQKPLNYMGLTKKSLDLLIREVL